MGMYYIMEKKYLKFKITNKILIVSLIPWGQSKLGHSYKH